MHVATGLPAAAEGRLEARPQGWGPSAGLGRRACTRTGACTSTRVSTSTRAGAACPVQAITVEGAWAMSRRHRTHLGHSEHREQKEEPHAAQRA
jgi:hypothetical protein